MSDREYETEREIGRLLGMKELTLALAESCTGGLIGHRVTSISGSSDYFLGGIVAYADGVKTREFDVNRDVLEKEGAVSEPVARQMAQGVKERFGSDIGLGVTGIAGPGGGTDEKPVGLVFIALAHGTTCHVQQFHFQGDRTDIKTLSSQAALEMLINYLRDTKGEHYGQEINSQGTAVRA